MSDQDQWGVGDVERARSCWRTTIGENDREVVEVIYGEHPHSRSGNNFYARDSSGKIYDYDGHHRVLMDVQLSSYNYLKSSYLSGDQIRKGGTCKILANRVQIYEFFFREMQWALREAARLVDELREHPSDICTEEGRSKLVGRKIYYRELPCVIRSLILDQGCVMIKREDGGLFPTPVYNRDDPEGHDLEREIKSEILSPHIWWWRK